MESCKTCSNYKYGNCEVLDDMLLVMSNVKSSTYPKLKRSEVEVIPKITIKDAYVSSFKCNRYR